MWLQISIYLSHALLADFFFIRSAFIIQSSNALLKKIKIKFRSLINWYWSHVDADDLVMLLQPQGMNSQSTTHNILGNFQPLMG